MNRISDLTRRLWAALLALCLVLALTLPVFAEGESETADTAEKETFHIGTVDDLLQLADSCRLDSWSKNRTVYLDADLELTGSGFAGIPSFSGVFEGQGHTISGLSLVDDGSVIGFFRYVQQGANIRDLVIRGRSMPTGSRSTVGGIAGSNAGTLHNCRFEGVSSGASVVGGIAGTNLAAGVIESCTTTGSVYGAHFIGGIAGENHGIIANCTNTSSVNTTVEQNDIDLSSLTLNDLIGTENAADITDISHWLLTHQSSSFSTMSESNGLISPPCGVPLSGIPSPSISDFNILLMIHSNRLSRIPNVHICFSSFPWFTLSKKPLMSTSTQ